MSLIFTVTCDHVLYDWKCDGDSVNWSPPTSPPESHVYHTSKCILCTNTHRLTTQAGSHTHTHTIPKLLFSLFFVPHSEQKHHIPLSDTSQKEPHLRANSGPAPELQHLLISAKFSGIKSLWILIFLFLLEPKHDLNTVSVLFDQETAGLGDDGGARMCIDVTQISFAHRRRGRARSPSNVTSLADEARLAASCGSCLGLWAAVLALTLVGGRFYCVLETTCWPWGETLSEASGFGWSTTLFESSGYTTW